MTMNIDFDKWWNEDDMSSDNPFSEDTPAYWAWEGWCAGVKAERETISDEWSMCVQSDLEHGVKSLNEQAAKDWFKNYPEISKFWGWLNARSNT